MDLGLLGKRAVVVGGTRGIGLSTAKILASEGVNVSICGRELSYVDSAVQELRDYNTRTYGEDLDVSNFVDAISFIQQSAKQIGGIDILVLNVSAQCDEWDRSYLIDIKSTVNIVENTLPFLRHSKSASIVAVASKAAIMAVPSYKSYSAMKAALVSYMASISRELAPIGIRVNVVSPGEIYDENGFWKRIEVEDQNLFRATMERSLVGRFAHPDEVARCIVFLSSPAASFVSGSHLLVDFAGHEHVHY